MTAEQQDLSYREATQSEKAPCHDVSPSARNPGHQLGVASFTIDNKSYYLTMIEGGPRDSMSFLGMETKFTDINAERVILNFTCVVL